MDILNEGSDLSLIYGIVAAVLLILFFVGRTAPLRQGRKNRSFPEVTTEAQVLDSELIAGDSVKTSWKGPRTQWYIRVTFRLADGQQIQLDAPETEKDKFKEGTTGTLTYQGSRYEAFFPHN